ncbi:hypothetical protein BD410DRAFT_810709, partial [Rickenella mellea]
MDYDDDPAPRVAYSMMDFTTKASELLEEDVGAFIQFTLTGRLKTGDGEVQVVVDPLLQAMPSAVDLNRSVEYRDYDSLLGISTTLPFLRDIEVFPIPLYRETLVEDIRISHEINGREVPLHKIPNAGFIKTKDRHITRIFFPALHGENRKDVRLKPNEVSEFYEKVVREAALELNNYQINDWPPSHLDEAWRASGARGGTYPSRKGISRWDVERFGQLLIEKCEEDLSFGKGAFFLHQYRGMKATTTHNPNNEEEARNALKDLFQDMHISMLEDAKWWVDVGMEVHVPGKAVLWRVDSHFALIQHFLDADEATAARN